MRGNSINVRPTIFIVDDDSAVRDALKLLLRSVGQAVETFGAGQEFLDAWCSTSACRACRASSCSRS